MFPRLLFYLLISATLTGCYGITHNPSQEPSLPFGDIVRTHAKPPGWAYFTNFDRKSCRLEVRPHEVTAPVQTPQVFIATIYGDDNQPRRNRRVEWMVEGSGHIVEVDESGFFPGRGYKVDNNYAVSYTDYIEHVITRGNDDPADDFAIRAGQSWCVASSAVEGDTQLTVYAPEINNWDMNRHVVTIHWVDAEWKLPSATVQRAGTPQVITTVISRHTDHRPLANYRVRYRVLDGPPAVFLTSRGPEEVAVSDLNGQASVGLALREARLGVSRIGIEIIRSPDPTAPSSAGIVIAQGETKVEWQAAQIGVGLLAPPAVGLGQEAAYRVTVTNAGKVDSQEVTLRDTIPDGLQFLRSAPPAQLAGNQLIWTLAALPAGQTHAVQTVFRTLRPGSVSNTVVATTPDGLHDEKSAVTEITVARLDVKMYAPDTAMTGVPVDFRITVSNPGTGPLANVQLIDTFDPGLEHDSRANPIKKPIGAIGPGESRTETLRLTPRQAGKFVNRVTGTAEGELTAQAEHALLVHRGQLKIEVTGPAKRYVNRQAVWQIAVTNAGEVPLPTVVAKDLLPTGLTFISAGQGGALGADGAVAWTIPLLQPGERHVLELTTNCTKPSPRAVNVVTASAPAGLEAKGEAAVEINGLPAFRLDVQDSVDPVEVGGKTTYIIDVINRGTLEGNQVEIVAIVPPELKVVNTRGPNRPPRIEGNRLIFPLIDAVPAGQKLQYFIDTQALQPGDARLRVELRTSTLREPVVKEESTTVYAPDQIQPMTTPHEPPMAVPPAN